MLYGKIIDEFRCLMINFAKCKVVDFYNSKIAPLESIPEFLLQRTSILYRYRSSAEEASVIKGFYRYHIDASREVIPDRADGLNELIKANQPRDLADPEIINATNAGVAILMAEWNALMPQNNYKLEQIGNVVCIRDPRGELYNNVIIINVSREEL